MAVAAAAIGAAGAWWFVSNRHTSPSELAGNEARPATVTEKLAAPIAPPEASPTPFQHLTATDGDQAQPVEESRARSLPAAKAPATVRIEAEPTRAKLMPTAPAAASGERVYIMEADLGDVVLNLDYIVARQGNPFAEINGVEVYLGSEIEGFVVESIEADRVVLRDEDGPLVLRVP